MGRAGSEKSMALVAAMLVLAADLAHAEMNYSQATGFLESVQLEDGSFDAFSSPNSAAAVLALNLTDPGSSNFSAGAGWLRADLENAASYSWSEADIPGLNLYAYSAAGNLTALNLSDVKSRLLALQGGNGGFRGYSQCVENCSDPDWTKQVWMAVEDSLSTSASLMGLAASCELDSATKNPALDYLISLQNEDGSFNLTNDTGYNQLMGLGPDPHSQTAFVLLGMRMAGKEAEDLSAPLDYLRNASLENFSNANNTFAAAMALLAFHAFNETNSTTRISEYLSTLQNPDGGFRDGARFGEGSNVLDTAAAILAAFNFTFSPPSCVNSTVGDPSPSPSPSPSASPTPSPSPSPSPTDEPTPTPQSYTGGNYVYSNSPTPTPTPTPEPSEEPSPEFIEIESEPSAASGTPTIKNANEERVAQDDSGNAALGASATPTPGISSATGLLGLGVFPSYAIVTLFIFISVGLYFGLRNRWNSDE